MQWICWPVQLLSVYMYKKINSCSSYRISNQVVYMASLCSDKVLQAAERSVKLSVSLFIDFHGW